MEGFNDLVRLSVGHKMFETKRASSRTALYYKSHILRRKTYSNVFVEKFGLHKKCIGLSAEKIANRKQYVQTKNKKFMVKTHKVMDLHRPYLQQSKFKLTKPKAYTLSMDRPVEVYEKNKFATKRDSLKTSWVKKRIGASVNKKSKMHQSFRMKYNKKPAIKTVKDMDFKRLHPKLQQPELESTQPKVDVDPVDRSMEVELYGHNKYETKKDSSRKTSDVKSHILRRKTYHSNNFLGILVLDKKRIRRNVEKKSKMHQFARMKYNKKPMIRTLKFKDLKKLYYNLKREFEMTRPKIDDERFESEKEMWEVTYDGNKMLGKGAYGKVFQGELINRKTGIVTKVAVKRHEMLRVDQSKTLIEMSLDHPNVIKLLHYEDFGDSAGKIFRLCCLELCNVSLDKAFFADDDPKKYRGKLPSEIEFMIQLSRGLDYIHSKNLVHRDIKPDNILINSSTSGRQVLIKLSDFLSSKYTKNGEFVLMSSGADQGTMYFWSPEIHSFYDEASRLSKESNDENALRITLTNKIDIFACGNVFFKFLKKEMHAFGKESGEIIINLRQSRPVNLIESLPTSNFAFAIIQKMLEKKEEDRPNVREIIPLLTSLQLNLSKRNRSFKTRQLTSTDDTYQQIIKRKQELHSLCSNPDPSDQQIDKIAQIVTKDTIGLLNIVDDNSQSPLLVLCQNNQSTSLLSCIKMMISKNHCYIKRKAKNSSANATTTQLDINYQDRNGFNALHYVCMKYEGDNLIEIIGLLVYRGIDVNRTERTFDRNALQLLIENNKNEERDLFNILQLFLNMGIDLEHKDINGWTVLHYLSRYHNRRNLIALVRLLVDRGVTSTQKIAMEKMRFIFFVVFTPLMIIEVTCSDCWSETKTYLFGCTIVKHQY